MPDSVLHCPVKVVLLCCNIGLVSEYKCTQMGHNLSSLMFKRVALNWMDLICQMEVNSFFLAGFS
jgi:hypothetical protein